MKKIFVLILALFLLFGGSAFSESIPSPDVRNLVVFESDYLTLSDFPNDLIPVDIVRVNLYGEYCEERFIQALFMPTYIPKHIHSVILTDGTHVAQAAFEIQGNSLQLYFYVPDLMRFDSTTGLWLVLIEQVK